MPVFVSNGLPSAQALPAFSAARNAPPLRVLFLNLMPKKEETERDFLRVFGETPLPIELLPMRVSGQTYKNTSQEYVEKYYTRFEDLAAGGYDGLVVTGAPLELMAFEDVRYWSQLAAIFDWATAHVRSSLFVCWGAQAALYRYYGVPKYLLPAKMFGIFAQELRPAAHPLFAGLNGKLLMPHSRHTETRATDLRGQTDLSVLCASPVSGVSVVSDETKRRLFVTGHLEYATETLDGEYRRDLAKQLTLAPPQNYYPDDNVNQSPVDTWGAGARRFYRNWLESYVALPSMHSE